MGVRYIFCKTEHEMQKMDGETKLSVSVCQISLMVLHFRGRYIVWKYKNIRKFEKSQKHDKIKKIEFCVKRGNDSTSVDSYSMLKKWNVLMWETVSLMICR